MNRIYHSVIAARGPPGGVARVAFPLAPAHDGLVNTGTSIDPALLDEDGLIRDFGAWTEALAEALARDSGVAELTETHWKIIRAMRENFARAGAAPTMHRVCRDAGVERRQVNELFGYCLVAWRVAGLPNPGEEAKSYLGSM